MKPVVEVHNLSKLYRLGSIGMTSLRESLDKLFGGHQKHAHLATKTAREGQIVDERMGPEPGTFWGLKDISFSVQPGRIVGVVGRNGAGKSAAQDLQHHRAASGAAVLSGRVVSPLEWAQAFDRIKGAKHVPQWDILGMRRAELRKFDEIVDVAEVAILDTL